jgi:hypothetical protein
MQYFNKVFPGFLHKHIEDLLLYTIKHYSPNTYLFFIAVRVLAYSIKAALVDTHYSW